MSGGCDGAVGALGDDLGANAGGVGGGDLLLEGRGHQHVALELQRLEGVGDEGGAGKARERAVLFPVDMGGLDVDAAWAVDGAVVLGDAHDHRAEVLEELGRPIAHVAQPLDDDALARNAGGKSGVLHQVRVRQKLADAERHTEPGCGGTAVDAAKLRGLASNTGVLINVVRVQGLVRVLDPRHLPRAGAVVRSRHVDARANTVAAAKLHCVPTDNVLEFQLVELFLGQS
mmetsp:Transcript_26942/g.46433  ORF Transcript_26942/g.46433 Transcript_26942/m.46433 type:complete len:230 (+) Transcript_26942:1014-1703(+)